MNALAVANEVGVSGGINIGAVSAMAIITGAGGIIALLFKLLIGAKDREHSLLMAQKDAAIAELVSVKKSYEQIAADALKSAVDAANYWRGQAGKAAVPVVAPVIPESQSPSTPKQRETANIATMQATLAAVKLACNLAPRPEPEQASESPKNESGKRG